VPASVEAGVPPGVLGCALRRKNVKRQEAPSVSWLSAMLLFSLLEHERNVEGKRIIVNSKYKKIINIRII
jgi:hypothetical protein